MSHKLTVITTPGAPQAVGPYSLGLATESLVFVSGQIPLDPATGELVSAEFGPQAERALANLAAVVSAAGCPLDKVIKVNVYLTDLGRFGEFNEIYGRFFGGHRPARAVVQVSALPRGAQVEVEAVVAR